MTIKERFKKIRNIPDSKNSLEYRDSMWEKYKHLIPFDIYKIYERTDDEIQDIMIASQKYYYSELFDRLSKGAVDKIDENDLVLFLKKEIKECYKDGDYVITQSGLDFIKRFVREIIYKTKSFKKYPNPLKNLDDVRAYHRSMCLIFIFYENINSVTISKLSTTMQLTGSVSVVSNFRPLSSAAILHKWGVEKIGNKKELNILVPSEGFFGRLLSSYYLAYHNKDLIINYHSIDPNTELVEPSKEIIKYLKNFGRLNKVRNWNPEIHWHGSEVVEAKIKEGYFDVIFTSPPYGMHEMYVTKGEAFIIDINSTLEQKEELQKTRTTIADFKIVSDENYKVGDTVRSDNKEWIVVKVNKNTQSHSSVKSLEGWKELFFRETVKNMNWNLKTGGYQIWNVANTMSYPHLEQDVLDVCQEEGLKLVATEKYCLTRRPGAKGKPPYEPVFVFQKEF